MNKFKILLLTTILFSSLCFANVVQALDFEKPSIKDESYKAQYSSQSVSDPITMEAGTNKEVIIRFKNNGTKTWNSSGYNYMSVYTVNEKYRESIFFNSNWLTRSNPTKLTATTKPGEIGEFKIKLTAPSKIGEYKEDFYLAAENITWIDGGYFYLKINVVENTVKINSVNIPALSSNELNSTDYIFTKYLEVGDEGEEVKKLQTKLKELGHYTYPEITGYFGPSTKQAVVLFQKEKNLSPFPGFVGPSTRLELNSIKTIKKAVEIKSDVTETITKQTKENISEVFDYSADIKFKTKNKIVENGGVKIDYLIIFNNTGSKEWNGTNLKLYGLYNKDGKTEKDVVIGNGSWSTSKNVKVDASKIVKGNNLVMQFSFNTPAKAGEYTAKFRLDSNDKYISGSELIIPITVSSDAPANYTQPSLAKDSSRALIEEPNIKVGLYSTEKDVKFLSKFDYLIYAGEKYEGMLNKNTPVTLSYLNGVHILKSSDRVVTSSEYIKLIPQDSKSYFELTNYTRTLSYRPNVNYNAYRGSLLYKYSDSKEVPYVVNELLLDMYMTGIAETDNASNFEYIKSVLIAARSYAYFNINNGLPQEKRTFDVYGSTIDQLYLGYNSEVAMPNVAKAARESYGQMVTYNNEPVTTPYFGHSDGYTRGWKEVWGGVDKPWLKPVEAKYDIGQSMYGHGVGMSNRDASFRAVKDGWDYEQILTYYYTDTKVEQIY